MPKAVKFSCVECDFHTHLPYNYQKHLETLKHLTLVNQSQTLQNKQEEESKDRTIQTQAQEIMYLQGRLDSLLSMMNVSSNPVARPVVKPVAKPVAKPVVIPVVKPVVKQKEEEEEENEEENSENSEGSDDNEDIPITGNEKCFNEVVNSFMDSLVGIDDEDDFYKEKVAELKRDDDERIGLCTDPNQSFTNFCINQNNDLPYMLEFSNIENTDVFMNIIKEEILSKCEYQIHPYRKTIKLFSKGVWLSPKKSYEALYEVNHKIYRLFMVYKELFGHYFLYNSSLNDFDTTKYENIKPMKRKITNFGWKSSNNLKQSLDTFINQT